jgi:hypothetical protein
MGTRSRYLEAHLRKNAKHKHMLLLLNKCDLVSGARRWLGRACFYAQSSSCFVNFLKLY